MYDGFRTCFFKSILYICYVTTSIAGVKYTTATLCITHYLKTPTKEIKVIS